MSFPGRLLETSVGRVFVHQEGSGPPLVLIHGMYVSHWYFRPVIGELRRHFTVTALDLPGFGESDRPAPTRYRYDAASAASVVAEVMDALGLGSAHVLGHSMGGGVALSLAARYPGHVLGLVLENAWVYQIQMPWLGRLALQGLVGGVMFRHLFSRRDLVRHFRSVFRDPALVTEALVDYYWERFNRAGAREAGHAALRAFAEYTDHNPTPSQVRAPTLVVWGEHDALFPLLHGKRLCDAIAGARLVVVPECAHSPHEERPADVLQAVIPFLQHAVPTIAPAPTNNEEAASGV